MSKNMAKRLLLLLTTGLCIQFIFSGSMQAAAADYIEVKELNFVFLHGMGSNSCVFQLLSDSIKEQLPPYILSYEQANPGTKIRVDTLHRCYPAYVDINTWANNIIDSIDTHFPNKQSLILIGHSMGGKAALYATA
ncbi:hypothetical protein ACFLTZ_03380 [Chloroflexota bacterium]